MKISGKWFDCWKNINTGKEVYSDGNLEFRDNQIQNTFSVLIAQLLMNMPSGSSTDGPLYLAFGHGDEAWDYMSMVDQDYNQTTLTDEFYRAPTFSQVKVSLAYDEQSLFYFVDSDYEESETPTNIIEAKIFLPEGVADGIHREFGLFGDDATITKDSGTMINWVRVNPAFEKTTGYELTRTVRLIFRDR